MNVSPLPRRLPARFTYQPAMKFEEIARELGTSTRAVWQTYVTAMNKIARRRTSLLALAAAVAEAQARRQPGRIHEVAQ